MSEPLEGPEAFLPLTAVGPGSTTPSQPELDAPGAEPAPALLDDDLELDPRPAGHELDLLDDIDPIGVDDLLDDDPPIDLDADDDADDDADIDADDADPDEIAPIDEAIEDADDDDDDDADEGDEGEDDDGPGPATVDGVPATSGGPRKRRRRGSRGARHSAAGHPDSCAGQRDRPDGPVRRRVDGVSAHRRK